MKLKNKFAIVTGASTGIGRAIGIEFAKEGTFVVLVARDYDRLAKTKEMIEEGGGKAEINPSYRTRQIKRIKMIDGIERNQLRK